jgi:putative transcriptional regulator
MNSFDEACVTALIEKWETGAKQPGGMASQLLFVVEKHGLKALV